MPSGRIITEESKRAELQRLGLDPRAYDIDNDTLEIKQRPPAPGIMATIAANAAMSLPETAASLAGAGFGAAQGARFHPVYGPIVGGLGGALAAPFVVGEENLAGWKNKLPESWRETASRGMEENPISGLVGQQLAALIGLKPSISTLKGTVKSIGTMLRGGVPTALQKAQMVGTGIGAGVGGAIPIGEDIAQGRDINVPRALIGAAGGAALNDPNIIGRKLFRLPAMPTPEMPQRPAAQTRDVSVNAPTPQASMEFAPEVSSALEDLGYKFDSPEATESFLAPVRDLLTKSPKARKTALTKLQSQISALETSAELLPMSKRMEALAEIDTLRKQAEAYPVADLIGDALREARVRGARIDYAPWETEGGMPGMGAEEGSGILTGDEAKARDYYAARAEEAAQPKPPAKLENLRAEALADALRLRQIEGSVETPRGKVTKYTRPESYGPDRGPLPQADAGPLSEAEQIQERYDQDPQMALLPGAKKQYEYGPGEISVKPRTPGNPFTSETQKLAKGPTPTHAKLADATERMYNNKRALEGRYSKHLRSLEKLSHEQQMMAHRALVDARRSGQPVPVADPQVQAAIDQFRANYLLAGQEQIADAQPVWERDANGRLVARQRGLNPTGFPMVTDEAVQRVIAEGQGTPDFDRLRQDFIDYQIANGVSPAEAEARFAARQGSFQRSAAGGNEFSFDAVRTPEGSGIPDSWIERDLMKGLRKYWHNFTKDRAFWNTIESDPELMAALGSRTYAGNTPIPPGINVPNLVQDPNVKNIWRAYLGKDNPNTEPIIAGAARLANSLILGGPITKGTDTATTPFKGLAYTAPGHADDVVKGLLHWREGYNHAFETGWNKPGGLTVVHDILGFGEAAGNKMAQLAQTWTKITGSEQLELFSRGLAQSIGEFIGDSWRAIATTGDQRAIDFLSRLGSDWQTISREELGTRIGMLMQGRYDVTNLPMWMKDSPVAPFLTMMRWSVEQTNNFLRFAVRPAIKDGNFRPLMLTLVGGLGGGMAINAMREKISGKKQYVPSVEELKAGYGKPGYADALAYKMMSAAQVTGTMGILSEILKQGYEELTKRQPQGFQFPVWSVGRDTAQRVSAAVDAVQKGEPWEQVTTALLDDIAKRNVQAYRIVRSAIGRAGGAQAPAEEIAMSNQRRDMDVWSRMMGRPIQQSVATAPSYSRLSEREFDRAPIGEAAGMIPSLVQRAISAGNGNPAQIMQNMQKLRTIETGGMPSPERDLQGFTEYYNWVAQTQGQEAASRLRSEYLRRLMETKMKRQLIPELNLQVPRIQFGG